MVKPPAAYRIRLQGWVLGLTFLLIEIQYSCIILAVVCEAWCILSFDVVHECDGAIYDASHAWDDAMLTWVMQYIWICAMHMMMPYVVVHMSWCIMVHMGMVHMTWCTHDDALDMASIPWCICKDASHNVSACAWHGVSMHISTIHNFLHASCSNCFINLSKNEKARFQSYGYVCAARLISQALLNHSPSADRSFWFGPSKVFLFLP